MSWGTGALKVSGVPDAVNGREVSMGTLEWRNQPSECLLTGTVTLK